MNSPKYETYKVTTFTEVFSGFDTIDIAKKNIATRIYAAGLGTHLGVSAINYHTDQRVYVLITTFVHGDKKWD